MTDAPTEEERQAQAHMADDARRDAHVEQIAQVLEKLPGVVLRTIQAVLADYAHYAGEVGAHRVELIRDGARLARDRQIADPTPYLCPGCEGSGIRDNGESCARCSGEGTLSDRPLL